MTTRTAILIATLWLINPIVAVVYLAVRNKR